MPSYQSFHLCRGSCRGPHYTNNDVCRGVGEFGHLPDEEVCFLGGVGEGGRAETAAPGSGRDQETEKQELFSIFF